MQLVRSGAGYDGVGGGVNQLELCRFIADVAHAAKGQTRADGDGGHMNDADARSSRDS